MKPFLISVIASCASALSAQESAPASRIAGIVLDDAGAPIVGAVCEIFENLAIIEGREVEGEPVDSTTSGEGGRFGFALTSFPFPERFVLKVRDPRHATAWLGVDTAKPCSAIAVKLANGSSISGKVLAKEGIQVRGASVSAYALDRATFHPVGSLEATTTTDSEGRYELLALNPGPKAIHVSLSGYATTSRKVESPTSWTGVDFTMSEGAVICGRVTAADTGASIADAWVCARSVEGSAQACVRTRRNGAYAIDGVQPGRSVVRAMARGFVPSAQRDAEGGSLHVDFAIEREAVISGRVVDDVTGVPVPSFELDRTATPGEVFLSRYLTRRFADSSGRFEYIGVKSGSYWLLARAPGYAGGRSIELSVRRGERVRDVEIRMSRGATLTGRVEDVKGVPISSAHVVLEHHPPSPKFGCGRISLEMLYRFPEAHTDAAGTFTFPHLLGGVYEIVVRHPDFASHASERFDVGDSGVVVFGDVILGRGAKIRGRLKLPDGSPDAKALVQVIPAAWNPNRLGHRSAYTDANGRFEAAGLAAGDYRVVVAQRNGQPDLASLFTTLKNPNVITLSEGEVKELDF